MRYLAVITGCILSLTTVMVAAAQEEMTLYERIQRNTERGAIIGGKAEISVKEYLVKLYEDSSIPFEEDDVEGLLRRSYTTACDLEGADLFNCGTLLNDVTSVASATQWIRTLGRDLQLIASSYEAKVNGYTGHIKSISMRYPSIVNIWQSGPDRVTSPVLTTDIRAREWPDDIEDKFDELESELEDLIEGEGPEEDLQPLAGAMHRYQHGINQVKMQEEKAGRPETCDNENDGVGDGSQLDLLFARWCDVEEKLEEIHDVIKEANKPEDFDPPLKPLEQVVFPPKVFEELNVILWIRLDDVGVMWDTALEPVLPALLSENSEEFCYNQRGWVHEDQCENLGGKNVVLQARYANPPEEPDPDSGLCSHPFARRGYLCRPVDGIDGCEPPEEEEDDDRDDDDDSSTGSVIHLTTCQPFSSSGADLREHITDFGHNVCELGGWKTDPHAQTSGFANTGGPQKYDYDTHEKDFEDDEDWDDNPYGPDECQNCIVDLECADKCDFGGQMVDNFAVAYPKTENGIVRICLPHAMAESGLLPGIIAHELVHAQQFCNLPPGERGHAHIFGSAAECCASERDAYYVQCSIYAEYGILQPFGYSIETCANAFANNSCSGYAPEGRRNACSTDELDTQEMARNVMTLLAESIDILELPTTCEDAVENLDPRALSIIHSLPRSCSPHCRSRYENTIGNNACFLGQCLEQSLETHRLIPGQVPYTVQDEAFPWDACVQPDPQLSSIAAVPPLVSARLPAYQPEELALAMDQAICQLNGKPRLTPPFLCTVDQNKRLGSPISNISALLNSLSGQFDEIRSQQSYTREGSYNVAARRATEINVQYLEPTIRMFADIIAVAGNLLKQMGDVSFPTAMCPRNYAGSCGPFNHASSE